MVYALGCAIFPKIVPIDRFVMVVAFSYILISLIAVAFTVKIVFLSFDSVPLALGISGAVIVSCALVHCQPYAAQQSAVFKFVCDIFKESSCFSVKALVRCRVKIIPVISIRADNIPPSGFQRAVDRVVGIAVQFKQTCYLALRYAVLSEVVVIAVLFILIARDLANTSHRYVINEVVEIISGLSPALPVGPVQRKAVFKCGVGGPEVGALFIGIVGVDEGDQAIGLLNAGIAGNGIQCAGAQIDVIAHFTGIFNGQAFIFIPLCVCLGHCLDPAEDTDGVGRCRVDRLGLVDPVADYSQRMGLFIEFRAGHGEIFVHQSHFGEVKLEIRVNMELHPYLSQHTDSLCQLQQEVPCSSIGIIAAGQQRHQGLDLLRNLNFLHVQRKDIGNDHLLFRIRDMIVGLIIRSGVGNITVPRKGAVSFCGSIKIEDGLVVFIHTDLDLAVGIFVIQQNGGNQHGAYAGLFNAGKHEALNDAGLFIFTAC